MITLVIAGTLSLLDYDTTDLLTHELETHQPPMNVYEYRSMGALMCLDMDETADDLEKEFPYHCVRASLLCPPPIAMAKEIDGDQEGFMEEYYRYLDTEPAVQEFIAVMLTYMHYGVNLILFSPALVSDQPIWLNVLLTFFLSRYGFSICTGPQNVFQYDPNFDCTIMNILYAFGTVTAFDYIANYPSMVPAVEIQNKIFNELHIYTGEPYENMLNVYQSIKNSYLTGIPVGRKPAVIFGS